MGLYKWFVVALMMLLVSGCGGNDESQWVTLDTQGQSKGSAVATSHSIDVSFSHQAAKQSQTTEVIKQRIAKFEAWADKRQFNVVPQHHEIRPVYEYREQTGREQVGYKAEQRFLIEGLSGSDYQVVLQELPSLTPDQFRLRAVEASEEAQSNLKARLITDAFGKAEAVAKTMQISAGLCDLQVASMNVHQAGRQAPAMMRMEAQADGVMHKSQAEEEQSIVLNVSWRAKHCDR